MLNLAGDNPLLMSGLALAGANLREQARPGQDDGILTGEEIASLDFTGTEWVVLSACDTGAGKVQNGEGILGLRRAFETAGRRSRCVGADRAILEARRKAGRSTRPFFWGGFVATGSWR
jgi:CHAT domain-containing protein